MEETDVAHVLTAARPIHFAGDLTRGRSTRRPEGGQLIAIRAVAVIADAQDGGVVVLRSRLLDDASSVFDASIQTGPLANAPVADTFNRKLERDYSTGDIPHV